MIRITCLGGAGSVTGSNYLVENAQGKRLMVDCGLFQGGKQVEARNRQRWAFDPKGIPTLFLTHAHIDHSGRIPKLVKDGFRGKIIATPPTVELCRIMLLDSAHVQEMDAEWQTRKNRRKGKAPVLPLYTKQDAEESLRYFFPLERDRMITVEPGIKARLRNAGHILGSAAVEVWVEDERREIKIVFSGDLGKKGQLIVKDPDAITDADYLFIESTYGNRLHRSFEDSKEEFLESIRYAHSHGEKVIIPAFALERTQELLYLLGEFAREGMLPDIPIYLDSPLAIKATKIFRRNKRCYDEETSAIVKQGFDPFDTPNLLFTPTTEESIAINEREGPAIIIAANGMCTAGRIKHHLKHNLWRPGASIVIVGFQAQGTTGRKIVDGEKSVKIFREDVAVKAKVFTIGGFSAHADQKDLLEWVGNFAGSRPRVFVVHGEPTASEALARSIHERFGMEAHIPKWKETLILKTGEAVREKERLEAALPERTETMLSTVTGLEQELERLRQVILERGGDREIGQDEVDRLQSIRDELREMLPEQSS
jgi:metallo-beta-lactamase family protein